MPKQKFNLKDRVEDNTIDLSLSELTSIPCREITSFKRVINVDLSSNKIISLGKNVGLLHNIVKLDLSKNLIKNLPENFGVLTSLRHLDLYDNRLEKLPISFGNLINLRYLDLKANPLNSELSKIVGSCLTAKECNEAAKNTVKVFKQMQIKLNEQKSELKPENNTEIQLIEKKKEKSAKQKEKKKKTSKSKLNNDILSQNINEVKRNQKLNQSKEKRLKNSPITNNTALKTVFVFFFLLVLNILAIYVMTVKNPEIVEKIVEFIPMKYRDLILSKTENMKLRISDYLQQFRTADEDHSYMRTN